MGWKTDTFRLKRWISLRLPMCILYDLANSDIRLFVCTAWVMWHQSDLQNNCGGAINQIGSGINHCAEDIFCHRCPLTITLRKTLALSLFLYILLFRHCSISQESGYWKAGTGSERCPFHSFKMQVKVYGVAFMPGIRKASRGEGKKKEKDNEVFIF